jgi:hypothetical protein
MRGMTLIERLFALAEHWARENKRSLSRLATIVVNDGKLFERLASGGSCTVATYERFIVYLREPTNWTGGLPTEVLHLLSFADHTDRYPLEGAATSSGTSPEISHRVAA